MAKSKKKKSKDKKKSDVESKNLSLKKNDIKQDEKNKILKSQCELLAEQLIKYKDQSSETAKLATKLKHELRKNDIKTTEMIGYLQNEIHEKDLQIEKLRNANYSLKLRAENHEKLTNDALSKMEKNHNERFKEMQLSLTSEIKELKLEIESLKFVKENKSEIENALLIAKTTMEAQAEKFKLSIDKLESKYIVDTQRIRQNAEKEIDELKTRAKEFAEQELNSQSRQLRLENKKYLKDLAFHSKTTTNLHQQNQKLMKKQENINQEIKLFKEKEMEQAKQCVIYKQRIKQLSSKLHRLEDTLNESTKESDKIHNKIIKQFNVKLNILKNENKTLNLNNKKLKNQLNSLKYYSKKLLSQRSEIEQFFHESLDEIKQKTKFRLQNKYKQELNEYNESLIKLGLNINSIQDKKIANDEIGILEPKKVGNVIKLEDLNEEEREYVLRILISKINVSSEVSDFNQFNETFLTQQQTTTI